MSERRIPKPPEPVKVRGSDRFNDPVAWMNFCLRSADRAIQVWEEVLQEERAGEKLPTIEYARIHMEAWQTRVRKLRFLRPAAPDNSFLDRLVVEAGWVFRQHVEGFFVGGFDFAFEVETLAYPAEAKLALEKAAGSKFDVEVIDERLAKLGEGEGPWIPRHKDPAFPYERCLEMFLGSREFGLRSGRRKSEGM